MLDFVVRICLDYWHLQCSHITSQIDWDNTSVFRMKTIMVQDMKFQCLFKELKAIFKISLISITYTSQKRLSCRKIHSRRIIWCSIRCFTETFIRHKCNLSVIRSSNASKLTYNSSFGIFFFRFIEVLLEVILWIWKRKYMSSLIRFLWLDCNSCNIQTPSYLAVPQTVN